jgi:hypothetical protein
MIRCSAISCSQLLLASVLAVGCSGQIGQSDPRTGGSNTGVGSSTGTGAATTSGTGNAGVSTTGAGGTGVGVTTGTGGTGAPTVCVPGLAATSQIARLTNQQYDRAVATLLGVTGLAAQGNVPPSTVLATDQAGSLTDIAWSNYQTVADMISTQVMADATLKKNFMACTPTGDGKSCLHDTIVKFGRLAFRRPLTTDEVSRFDNIVANGASMTPDGTVDEIAGTVLYMFLISPSFIQRAEVSGTPDSSGHYTLSSWEVASRLSFLLWGSIPDATLNTAADNNQLQTPAQILTQAQRMVKTDAARQRLADFHASYMLIAPNTRWDNTNHDTSLFPAFDKSIVPSLIQETTLFFDNVAFAKQGTFQDLLTSPYAYVNSQTAALYGLSASGRTTTFQEVKLDATRPGFLTRVGFLNAYSYYNRTSPIYRGAFITKQILGTALGSPPPGATQTPLPDATADLNTNRKLVDAQTAGGVCESCHHTYINPPGDALEGFNAVGQPQTTEATTGAAIDTTADIAMDGTTVHVTGAADLMAKIAASPMAQHRYADRWVAFAYERDGDPNDCGTVNTLSTNIGAGGYTILNLMTDLTQTDSFRLRAEEN